MNRDVDQMSDTFTSDDLRCERSTSPKSRRDLINDVITDGKNDSSA